MDFMDVFDLSNNILAPGIVVGMEKVTDHWVVGQLDQLRYKVIDNTQVFGILKIWPVVNIFTQFG